jgi:hypothetical protein
LSREQNEEKQKKLYKQPINKRKSPSISKSTSSPSSQLYPIVKLIMKFTSAFSLLAYAIKVGTTQAEEATCDKCLSLPPDSKSFQTIRYYNITDPNWTAEQAMEEAAKTTALQLAKMPGFQRYTAATTGDSQLVLFMNQFASAEQAKAAQDAAANNPDPSWANANDGKLELFISTVTEGFAAFPQDSCFTESQVGKLLVTHLYTYQDPASVDPTTLFPLQQDYYNMMYKNAPGFVMSYSSTNAPQGDDKSQWRIMESEADEAAYQELKAESNYAWTGPAEDEVISTAGIIGIDILCAEHHLTDATDVPVPPPAPATTSTAKASKASSAKSSKT